MKTVSVYFTSDAELVKDCGGTVATQRQMPASETGVARKSLEMLFDGPTTAEQAKGLKGSFTGWNEVLKSVSAKDETVYVNFTKELLNQKGKYWVGNFGSSCGSGSWEQIRKTAGQFPNIKYVVFSIDDNPAKWTEFVWGTTCEERLTNAGSDPFIQKQCGTVIPK
ncbi:MAG: hypothetical protein OHK0017_03000 [Patescibacteria group bacterium]